MTLLFRENASLQERLFTCVLVMLFIFGGFGLSLPFKQSYWFSKIALLLTLIFGILFYLPLLMDKHPKRLGHSDKLFMYLLRHSFLMLLMLGMWWGFIGYAAPSIYTKAYGELNVDELNVIKKSSGRHKRFECDHSITGIVTSDKRWKPKMCLDRSAWESVHVGDTIEIKTFTSNLGKIID